MAGVDLYEGSPLIIPIYEISGFKFTTIGQQGPEYFTIMIVIALKIESKKSLIIKSLKNHKYVLAT